MKGAQKREGNVEAKGKKKDKESLVFIGTQGVYFTLEEIISLKIHRIRVS